MMRGNNDEKKDTHDVHVVTPVPVHSASTSLPSLFFELHLIAAPEEDFYQNHNETKLSNKHD
jgi:hypothetical protein